MEIEKLSRSNVREAMFCCRDRGEAGEQQLRAFEKWLDQGRLYGHVARNDGQVVGMIIYFPIEQAPVEIEGKDLLAVQCMWVHPENRGCGLGRRLVRQVCDDARRLGRKGMVMEGFTFPADSPVSAFMPRDYFLFLGFRQLDHHWHNALLFLPLAEDADPPVYSGNVFAPPPGKERLRIDILECDKCVGGTLNVELVRRVLPAYEGQVELFTYDQNDRQNVLAKGRHFGVFFDGHLEYHGAPITEEQVRNTFEQYLAQRQAGCSTIATDL